VGLLNISLSALIEVSQEVSEDIDGALASWQRWDCVGNARGEWSPGAKVKLEPARKLLSTNEKEVEVCHTIQLSLALRPLLALRGRHDPLLPQQRERCHFDHNI